MTFIIKWHCFPIQNIFSNFPLHHTIRLQYYTITLELRDHDPPEASRKGDREREREESGDVVRNTTIQGDSGGVTATYGAHF
jgi:hypothetical protein